MNYETVVTDLFKRFPKFQLANDTKFAYMGKEKPGAYIVLWIGTNACTRAGVGRVRLGFNITNLRFP
jgi:hypothetical protein